MIVKEAKGYSGRAYVIIPKDSDDLFALRRTIKRGDLVVGQTTRIIKHVKQYGRPEKGDRIKVMISLRVEDVSLYDSVDRLRVTGIITDTNNENVSKGSHHSMTVRINDTIMIEKNTKWHGTEIGILTTSGISEEFILVSIDTQEAAVAKVSGTHLEMIPNIYSGQSGKRYQSALKSNPNIENFFADVAGIIQTIKKNTHNDYSSRIIIFGPGEAKRKLLNYLNAAKDHFEKEQISVVEGVDVAGEDGIYVFLRSNALKEVMSSSKLSSVSSILDEVLKQIGKGENKYALGTKEITDAASMRNIKSVIFSDAIFKSNYDEETIMNLLNLIEMHGGRLYAVDSSTDLGLRVSSLGGIVALLRYSKL